MENKNGIGCLGYIIAAVILIGLLSMCSGGSYSSSRDPIFDKDPSSWTGGERQHFSDVYID